LGAAFAFYKPFHQLGIRLHGMPNYTMVFLHSLGHDPTLAFSESRPSLSKMQTVNWVSGYNMIVAAKASENFYPG
jgi:hypothetical protein